MQVSPQESLPSRIFQKTFSDPEQQTTSSLAGRRLGRFCRQGLLWLLLVVFSAGCGIAVVGLHPRYPRLEKKTFAIYPEFVEVDSLQPSFHWQAFPKSEDSLACKVREVTYELRIWRMTPGESGKVVYARRDLKSPYHKLEEPLEPASKYFWSVRARFLIEGHRRVTEWGLAGIPLRNEAVPNQSCFRFQTPARQVPEQSLKKSGEKNLEEGAG
jgi:hypothetical protein